MFTKGCLHHNLKLVVKFYPQSPELYWIDIRDGEAHAKIPLTLQCDGEGDSVEQHSEDKVWLLCA